MAYTVVVGVRVSSGQVKIVRVRVRVSSG